MAYPFSAGYKNPEMVSRAQLEQGHFSYIDVGVILETYTLKAVSRRYLYCFYDLPVMPSPGRHSLHLFCCSRPKHISSTFLHAADTILIKFHCWGITVFFPAYRATYSFRAERIYSSNVFPCRYTCKVGFKCLLKFNEPCIFLGSYI